MKLAILKARVLHYLAKQIDNLAYYLEYKAACLTYLAENLEKQIPITADFTEL